MQSQHINPSFERLPISEAARGKHLFPHSVLDITLLIEEIMELSAFARINVATGNYLKKKKVSALKESNHG